MAKKKATLAARKEKKKLGSFWVVKLYLCILSEKYILFIIYLF
nr:MAG TPA: hypothetical protein [Caudoviricetes sp.]